MSLLLSHTFLTGVKVLSAAHKALYDLPSPPLPAFTSSTPASLIRSGHTGLLLFLQHTRPVLPQGLCTCSSSALGNFKTSSLTIYRS